VPVHGHEAERIELLVEIRVEAAESVGAIHVSSPELASDAAAVICARAKGATSRCRLECRRSPRFPCRAGSSSSRSTMTSRTLLGQLGERVVHQSPRVLLPQHLVDRADAALEVGRVGTVAIMVSSSNCTLRPRRGAFWCQVVVGIAHDRQQPGAARCRRCSCRENLKARRQASCNHVFGVCARRASASARSS